MVSIQFIVFSFQVRAYFLFTSLNFIQIELQNQFFSKSKYVQGEIIGKLSLSQKKDNYIVDALPTVTSNM